MKYFGVTDKGKTRPDNQDAFAIKMIESRNILIAVLCDGMGGQNAGALASNISVGSFMDYVVNKLTSRVNHNPDFIKILIDACNDANSLAFDYSTFDPGLNGMGSTIVGALIKDDGHVQIINLGDSRGYLITKDGINQITTDHSLVEDLVRSGAITREQAKTHKQRSIITKALGSETTVDPDVFETVLGEGEMLMLCSDGLTNYVSDDDIYTQYLINSEPEHFCESLLSMTYLHGAGDNVTIISVVNDG